MKLAEADLVTIKALHGAISQKEIARRFGVSRETIRRVLVDEIWPALRKRAARQGHDAIT